MKCGICNNEFNDGVQCSSCGKYLDYGCAKVTELGYRKLGPEKKAKWRCPQCKTTSSPGSGEVATLDSVLREVRDVKFQLACIPTLMSEVKGMRQELSDLKKSQEFVNKKLEEQDSRLKKVENRMPELQSLHGHINTFNNSLADIKKESRAREQWSRLNNAEVKGVPLKKGENLFKVVDALCSSVNYEVPKSQINYIARVPTYNSNEKSIIISFINRYVKEEFIAAARAKKTILAEDLGFSNNSQRIYVNDHLTPDSKSLLTKAKAIAKKKEYQYTWVKYGKVHIRKNDSSPVLIISSESDLNKIV